MTRNPHSDPSPLTGTDLLKARQALPTESTRANITHMMQRELAERLGITSTEVYRKESGERLVTRAQGWALVGLLYHADHARVAERLAKKLERT